MTDDTREKIQMDIASQYSRIGPEDCFVHSDAVSVVSLASSLQKEIDTWSKETFAVPNQDHQLTKLTGEFKELVTLTTDPDASDEEIAEEMADMMHLMFQLAERYDFDLLEATRKKFEKNKLRTWVLQEDGTYQHVEGGHE